MFFSLVPSLTALLPFTAFAVRLTSTFVAPAAFAALVRALAFPRWSLLAAVCAVACAQADLALMREGSVPAAPVARRGAATRAGLEEVTDPEPGLRLDPIGAIVLRVVFPTAFASMIRGKRPRTRDAHLSRQGAVS